MAPRMRDRLREIFKRSSSPSPAHTHMLPPTVLQPVTIEPPIRTDFLAEALKQLEYKERATIQAQLSSNTISPGSAIDKAYDTASSLQQLHASKRLKWNYKGHDIYLQDQADKALRLLSRFKSVGDVVANVDPMHVGLPWAGVRILLEVALAKHKQEAAILTGIELALYTSNQLKDYFEFYAHLPASLQADHFREAIIVLFAHVLRFLAHAMQTYEKSSVAMVAQAIWDTSSLTEFEEKSESLCGRVAQAANNCDRLIARQWKDELDAKLQSLDDIHGIQTSLAKIQDKADLAKLVTAREATYNSSAEGDLPICLPDTRTTLLHQIANWTTDRHGKRIFWLCGKAGTGKSTISRTVAQRLDDESRLGASFYFKRGRADRNHAKLFFPTIARQLADNFPALGHAISAALEKNSLLHELHLTKQFKELLLKPMLSLEKGNLPEDIFIVMDALDECEDTQDIGTVLRLLKQIETITTARLRILVTSRPNIPILLEFGDMSKDLYHDIRLEEAQATSIKSDLCIFFRDEFAKIKRLYPLQNPWDPLLAEWPGDDKILLLVDQTNPLFIAASTVCRYISEDDPQGRLSALLRQYDYRSSTGLWATYLPVLNQAVCTDTGQQINERLATFQAVIGPLVLLSDPLSVKSLSRLFEISVGAIGALLQRLQSVLSVPQGPDGKVTLFHLSFRDLLINPGVESQFRINEAKTHGRLAEQCIRLLSTGALVEDVCKLKSPGTRRADVRRSHIAESLPEAVAYACCYWVQHVVDSSDGVGDGGFVHEFLKTHFLHWMEALSWLGKSSDAILNIGKLQSVVNGDHNVDLLYFLNDASRFAFRNRFLIDHAPLQTYLSALIFSPTLSIIRKHFDYDFRAYLDFLPNVPAQWSAETQKLEGHDGGVRAVAISPDGKTVASGSDDRTVRLWSTATGEQTQKLEGHDGRVWAVAISPDGKTVASGSNDQTVRLWSTATGEQTQKLEGHDGGVCAVAISPDGKTVASGSNDRTVRLWSTATGEQTQKLEGHDGWVCAVAISPDGKTVASGSDDRTVRLWSTATGEQTLRFENSRSPTRLRFANDGTALETDVGLFELISPSCCGKALSSSSRATVALDSPWVKYNESDLLWLPHEYRGVCSATHGTFLAIGQASGAMSLFSFKMYNNNSYSVRAFNI